MATYQVAIVRRPDKWKPEGPDDVPLDLKGPLRVLDESEDLFVAVRQAVEFNQGDKSKQDGQWAVVVEPGSLGCAWPAARLCTPILYKVTAIWWPEGWEPNTPLDVPNCVFHVQGRQEEKPLSYEEAETAIGGLNRQCMDQPGTSWYVIMAVESESISQTVSYDPAGTETTVEVRRLHVIRPEKGGHGDCAHCPAHNFECARASWSSHVQTMTSQQSRSYHTQLE